jgi:hypothetical protein
VNAPLLLVSLLSAVPDLAPPPPATPSAPAPPTATAVSPAPERGWYGAPAAVADGAAIAMIVGGAALAERGGSGSDLGSGLFFVGATGFIFGGPLNHVLKEHPGRAAASLGLRLLATLTGGVFLVLHRATSCTEEHQEPDCARLKGINALALAAPFVAIGALDDFAIARGTIPPPRQPAPAGPTITPVVGPDWAMLSVGGAF